MRAAPTEPNPHSTLARRVTLALAALAVATLAMPPGFGARGLLRSLLTTNAHGRGDGLAPERTTA